MENWIPWMFSALSLLIAFVSLMKNNAKDDTEDKKDIVSLDVKLNSLITTCTEIRTDIKSIDTRTQTLDKKVVVLERDLATAFIRIDELRNDIKKEG